MNKNFLSFILVLLGTTLVSLTSKAQTYYQYTIEGVEYKAIDDVFNSVAVYARDLDSGKKIGKYISVSNYGVKGYLYTPNVNVFYKLEQEFKPQTFTLDKDYTYLEKIPVGFIEVTKVTGQEYNDTYQSKSPSDGFIKITRVDETAVEGEFECTLHLINSTEQKILKITNGKFRFPAENLQMFE